MTSREAVLEDVFLAARHALALLQAQLAELRAKANNTALPDALRTKATKLLQKYLEPLRSLHAAVQRFLLASDGQRHEELEALFEYVAEVAEWVDGLDAIEEGRTAELAAMVRQQRAAKLDEEVAAMSAAATALRQPGAAAGSAAAAAPQAGCATATVKATTAAAAAAAQELASGAGLQAAALAEAEADTAAAQVAVLEAVLRTLAVQEQSLDFHVRLAKEVAARFGGVSSSAAGAGAEGEATSGQETTSSPALTYTPDNFAYGSTPFTSWLKVVQAAGEHLQPAMRPRLQPGGAARVPCSSASAGGAMATAAGNDSSPPVDSGGGGGGGGGGAAARTYVVWGSSCGWLVLFGAAVFGWRCRGVELLRCLHDVAQGCLDEAERQGLAPGRVCLRCGDLLQDNVQDAGLVLMSDQCWDHALAAAAAEKLAQELPSGALVISYSGSSCGGGALAAQRQARRGAAWTNDERTAREGAAAQQDEGGAVRTDDWEAGPAFAEVAVCRVPVSWNPEQALHVWRRC